MSSGGLGILPIGSVGIGTYPRYRTRAAGPGATIWLNDVPDGRPPHQPDAGDASELQASFAPGMYRRTLISPPPSEDHCLVSPKVIAVAVLSSIALAVSGCGGGSDAEAESPVGFPKLTTTWVSPTNGFSFRHMEGRGPTPAKEPWDPVIDPPVDTSSRYDDPFDLWETGYAAFFKSASTRIPEGVSIDEWVDEHVSPRGCGGPRSQQAKITIDGQSG